MLGGLGFGVRGLSGYERESIERQAELAQMSFRRQFEAQQDLFKEREIEPQEMINITPETKLLKENIK